MGSSVDDRRSDKLREDLEQNKFDLTYEQKTIINHYFRTPVTIISGHLENIQSRLNFKTYNLIKKELDEIIEAVELINGSNNE
jgi:signal transduction histidine kinase